MTYLPYKFIPNLIIHAISHLELNLSLRLNSNVDSNLFRCFGVNLRVDLIPKCNLGLVVDVASHHFKSSWI